MLGAKCIGMPIPIQKVIGINLLISSWTCVTDLPYPLAFKNIFWKPVVASIAFWYVGRIFFCSIVHACQEFVKTCVDFLLAGERRSTVQSTNKGEKAALLRREDSFRPLQFRFRTESEWSSFRIRHCYTAITHRTPIKGRDTENLSWLWSW